MSEEVVKKMDLEYKINKGSLEIFEKDIRDYHFKRIATTGGTSIKFANQLRRELKKKYNLSTKEFSLNYYIHTEKICRNYCSEYGNERWN